MKKKATFMQCQLAFYFEKDLDRPDTLWNQLSGNLSKFDQTPIILPIPVDPTLSEVPVVQVVSKNGSFRLNISRKRMDFFIYGQGKDATFNEIKDLLLQTSDTLVNSLQSSVPIRWIGMILNYFIEEQNSATIIADLLDSKFKRLHGGITTEATIDYIEKIDGLNKKIHNHTLIQKASAKFKNEDTDVTGLSILRDFNTKSEENGDGYVNSDFVKKFINFEEENLKLEELVSILWKN